MVLSPTIPDWDTLDRHLESLRRAALDAADPDRAVARCLALEPGALRLGARPIPLGDGAGVVLIALGKAAPGMARAALRAVGPLVRAGVIAHPHELDPGGGWPAAVRRIPAGHPLPDAGSLAAGEAAVELLSSLAPDDLALVLISGGGSALMEALRPGIELETLQRLTRELQHAGADIQELNTVRRALSRLKGGGMLRLAPPARVAALLLSDVMGDDPAAIASGPVVRSPTGATEALAVLARFGLEPRFEDVRRALHQTEPATTAAEAAAIEIVGSNRLAAVAAAAAARAAGFSTLILTEHLQGEAREAGRLIGGIARSVREHGLPLAPPACVILGGETTVTVRGSGRGGRNHELALGAAFALEGCARTAVFSFATDGLDGTSGAAGALATGDTLARSRALGLAPLAALAASDTGPFFAALGDQWRPGPSGTNVNDLALILVYP